MAALDFFPCPSRHRRDLTTVTVFGAIPFGWRTLCQELARDLDCSPEDFGDHEAFWGGEYGDDHSCEVVTYDGEIIGSLDRELTDDDVAQARAYLLRETPSALTPACASDDYGMAREHSTMNRAQQGI
jgi:hypothetical protein